MSYSQRFHDSITISGSQSVSYPASQNGGSTTVHYSETVPIDVTIYVRTEPFDESIGECNQAIDWLTGSVVAMNTAQCAAITQTGNEVSESIIGGFYGLINSEISQQMTQLNSRLKSKLGLIMQQSKAVTQQTEVMNTDYNRIKSRYTSVFRDLDEECRKRIVALDRPSFDLTKKSDGIQDSVATIVSMHDTVSSRLFLETARLRKKVSEVLGALASNVMQEQVYLKKMQAILASQEVSDTVATAVPVLYLEQDVIGDGKQVHANCYQPDILRQDAKYRVESNVLEYFNDTRRVWHEANDKDFEKVNSSFSGIAEELLAQNPEQNQRLYTTIMQLWKQGVPLRGERND